jgi:hypothetical protein
MKTHAILSDQNDPQAEDFYPLIRQNNQLTVLTIPHPL